MNSPPITELLERWKAGEAAAEESLLKAVYPVLRDLARAQVRRNSGALALQATELANEAYIKLCQQHSVDWQSRDHFYAIAATVIRRVVVDYLRQRGSEKRGGGLPFVSLHDLPTGQSPVIDDNVDWLSVDQALTELAQEDPACARVVELRVFSGLTAESIAAVCGNSPTTVNRQWRYARAWLVERLGPDFKTDGR